MLMKFEELENKTIIVKQLKSVNSVKKDQLATIKGLGLNGINSTFELKCDKSIYGMLFKVKHLIDVKIK